MDGTNTYPVPNDLIMYSLDTYIYSCMEGYTTDDQLYTVCRPDGSLSLVEPPNCTGKTDNYNFLKFMLIYFEH